MAAAPPASPGTAFPAGDPRNALYFETLGKLEHGEQRTLGQLGEQRSNAKAAATYKEGLLTGQEPQTYAANRYRGVREGVASSGVNAERRGGIATNYANRRFSVQQNLKQQEGRISRSEQETRERAAEGRQGAGTHALVEGYNALLANPPQAEQPSGPSAAEMAGGYTVGTTGEQYRTVRPYAEQRAAIKWSRDPRVRAEQQKRGY